MPPPRIRIVLGGPMLVEGYRSDASPMSRRLAGRPTPRRGRALRDLSMRHVLRDAALRPGGAYASFEEEPANGPDPAPFRWDVPDPAGPPALALKPNGPVRVAGRGDVTYGDAPPAAASPSAGAASLGEPSCDSSHRVVGYRG